MTASVDKENIVSVPQNRLTPAPVRQDAICMCAHDERCSSFAPGHAVHLIQSRLVSATPSDWVDAIVTAHDPKDGTVELHTLGGERIELWNGAGAAHTVVVGAPVAFHARYHVLAVGAQRFNVLALG